MSEILQYKLKIKEWERGFAAKHGRIPSKADVKADEEIRRAYKAYNDLKRSEKHHQNPSKSLDKSGSSSRKPSGSSSSSSSSRSSNKRDLKDPGIADGVLKSPLHQSETSIFGQKKRHKSSQESPFLPSVDIQLTDDEDYEPLVPVQNAELGPTPQANGKVLSIFDLILSPPESLPLKQQLAGSAKLLPPSILTSGSPFKTPSKAVKRIDFGNLSPSRGLSVAEKLRMASSPKKTGYSPKSPTKNDILETPLYLGKVNNKFSFTDRSPFGESPSKQPEFHTPTKPQQSTENFQVSPSPLKTQRFLLKKLSDIFNAQQNLVLDEEFEAQRLEFEKEFEENEKALEQEAPTQENIRDMRRRKKATTQKRTTRRWKIKPRTGGEEGDTFEGKDVHEEIQKLETQDRLHLEKYIEGEGSDEEVTDEEEEEVAIRKEPASTKINPISNNYQRLKINDPRAKKFKQRMKRR